MLRMHSVIAVVVALLLAVIPSVAMAQGAAGGTEAAADTGEVVDQISEAVGLEQANPAAPNPDVSIPAKGSGLVTLDDNGSSQLTVDLPAKGPGEKAGLTTVFDAGAPGSQIAVQPTAAGLRTLVHIEGPEAPERYPFALGGDVARLQQEADGSVAAYDSLGQEVTHIDAPWARDATGRDVPTHYEIEGTTLVQVVAHRGGGFTYGITADPNFWSVAKCTAAITFVVGSSLIAVSKLTKIRAVIKGFGGIRETARILLGASTKSEKLRVLGGAGASAAAEFFSISAIRDNC